MIREAVLKHIYDERGKSNRAWEKRHKDKLRRLFVSDLGHCPRKAYLRMRGEKETHPFDIYVQEIMRAGIVWEAETELALRAYYGDKLQTQVGVSDGIWSGRIDFLLPDNTVIEHKATSPVNFVRKDRLPYQFHCLQVLGYCELLRQTSPGLGIPVAILYYRSWANWAEIKVWQEEYYIGWHGEINGKTRSGQFEVVTLEEMAKFNFYWNTGVLPPKYETPFIEQFGCTRFVKKSDLAYPSCTYFGACWPNMGDGPFRPGEEEWPD